MKTTKEKMAEAIKAARRKLHDQVEGGVTHSDMTSREMRDDIAEYLAQAALDVVLGELEGIDMLYVFEEAYEKAKPREAELCNPVAVLAALKAAADRLRG